VSYDGARYFGFQYQPHGLATVQGEVEAALTRLTGRGLHSSTFRLNISAFCGTGVHLGVV